MGPPIHIQYCLHKNGIQQNLNSLSPIWTSMIWGLEQKSNAKRIVALKALNVLLESDIRGKVKNTLNTNNRTREQYENSFNRVKSSALLKLLRNMRSNDPDPAIKEIFGQIIDKITTQFKSESYNEQVDKPSRLLKTIWTKLSSAENLPSKPSHISRSQ
ncbi:unnamed protein product [Heterobilharzia americana]|nr:unnamed protein product [Heterobilharzia americana]